MHCFPMFAISCYLPRRACPRSCGPTPHTTHALLSYVCYLVLSPEARVSEIVWTHAPHDACTAFLCLLSRVISRGARVRDRVDPRPTRRMHCFPMFAISCYLPRRACPRSC